MKMDRRVTESLARVNASEPHLTEWLKSRLERHQDQMESMKDDVSVRWAQGRVQEIKAIMKAISTASDNL